MYPPAQNYIVVGFLPLFLRDVASKIHSKDYSSLHELYADIYRINAELQQEYANSQDKRPQKATQRLYSSSNENLSSLRESINNEFNEGGE